MLSTRRGREPSRAQTRCGRDTLPHHPCSASIQLDCERLWLLCFALLRSCSPRLPSRHATCTHAQNMQRTKAIRRQKCKKKGHHRLRQPCEHNNQVVWQGCRRPALGLCADQGEGEGSKRTCKLPEGVLDGLDGCGRKSAAILPPTRSCHAPLHVPSRPTGCSSLPRWLPPVEFDKGPGFFGQAVRTTNPYYWVVGHVPRVSLFFST